MIAFGSAYELRSKGRYYDVWGCVAVVDFTEPKG
jgi:hypothetical protein